MFGLYIHFPFCVKKCNYCDFLSAPVVNRNMVTEYLRALQQELAIYRGLLKDKGDLMLGTVYLGGGTPTLLEAQQLVRVLEKCQDLFAWSPQLEATIEANPGTVDLNKLIQLKKVGINRISFGVQSFDQHLLKSMGRIHTPQEAKEGIAMAKAAGFENISIDLMYGLPDQTLSQWEDTLHQALDLGIQHISVYGLQVEEGTVWGNLEAEGKLPLPEEELIVTMRKLCNELLSRAGFKRYEISNYAIPGYESKHNMGYWLGRPYLGLGLGASSDFWQRRFVNTSDLKHYIDLLKQGQLPLAEEEILSYRQRMGEAVFLGLRLIEGLDLERFKSRFGVRAEVIYSEEIEKLRKMGLIRLTDKRLQLTPQAFPIANYVFTFFV